MFGSTDKAHPGVAYVLDKVNPVYVAGQLEMVTPPVHYDYKALRLSPAQLRSRFYELGWERVVAFQTRNPMHRAHVELTLRAARQVEANLLVHPSVGHDQAGRRGPPHPGALLPGRTEGLPARHRHSLARCRWPCAWAGPERLFGTP